MQHAVYQRRSGLDRRTRRDYRFYERRHGFDARKRYPVLGPLRTDRWALLGVIAITNMLSLFDGYFTLHELDLGIATEANPVFDVIVQRDPMAAIAFKTLVVLVISALIWLNRRRRPILIMALVALGVFSSLAAYHLVGLRSLGPAGAL